LTEITDLDRGSCGICLERNKPVFERFKRTFLPQKVGRV